MLPPVEESVLQNNPDFAKLYKILTTVVLNEDGSSKSDVGAKQREAAQQARYTAPQAPAADVKSGAAARRAARANSARPSMVMREEAPQEAVPQELADLLVLLPALLQREREGSGGAGEGARLSNDDVALLMASPPLSRLPEHLPRLAQLVSANLQAAALALVRVANPMTNPSYLHRGHGPVGRALELRAAEVALAAQTSEVQARSALATGRRVLYPPEAVAALRRYANHLRDGRMRLDEALRERRAVLADYGIEVDSEDEATAAAGGSEADTEAEGRQRKTGALTGKEKTMREMARVYRQMEQQMQEVQSDLARLGRA
ncbi:hypothetical protein CMQ_6515 [Grosmannia clavigera kw1407]|uniref:Uncharacterized protein n=1 Tax=Grosmannia clavigera (strain kw1407 / UAMH 11150) TaxID=655863 RepID=F0X7T4_GROCL|nr:uncharacterized protein CMQ_6515 [Grosmannia clavigera kw1407]EFX06194.1 hypothetical protein CMQ_6515 [Grosmannia clavigera kw1407]